MDQEDYWIKFWKSNIIVDAKTPHQKVGRTINGIPIEEHKWQEVLSELQKQLNINSNDCLLDIGAGSGVISIPFSKIVKNIVAVDVSNKLLAEMEHFTNIKTMEADARHLNFEAESFDKIIIYFAIQHFTEEETTRLAENIFKWLKPGGILYIGDIPDVDRKFVFFNTLARQEAYFNSLKNESPIIGTWFHKDFFMNLGPYSRFSSTEIIVQPNDYINTHYRFDAKFVK